MRRFLIGLLLVLCSPGLALAWSELGHRTVAEVASRHLSTAAARAIPELLGDGLERLVDIAGWADDYREENLATYPWHIVEIPPDGNGYDHARDCPKDDCIVEKIKEFSRTLGDAKAPLATRALALRFVVHFVGDIHMPLHALAPLNHPSGTWIRIGDTVDTLHLWWDNEFVDVLGTDADAIADLLEDQFRLTTGRDRALGTPEDWTNESFVIARDFVQKYDILAAVRMNAATTESPLVLPESVIDDARPVVTWRLYLGGLRLARLLNEAFE